MPSSLSQSIFDLLQVYNGPWGLSATPPGVQGNVQGGPNNDKLEITGLAGVVNGNGGNDHITLGAGLLNIVNGGDGSDQIFGNAGINILNGNNGNDYIVGGGGADTLNGGPSASGGTAANPDVDTLSYESATGGGITLTLNANGGVNVGQFLPGRSNAGLDVIAGGFENVVGTNSADTITGNAEKNVLIGLAGNDKLNGGGGDDILDGGDGNDILNGDAGNDILYGGNSDPNSLEQLFGGAGNDIIYGGPGPTRSYGGSGDDTFVFTSLADFNDPKAPPGIEDFQAEDRNELIDLSAIDANQILAGDQSFTLVERFSGNAGELVLAALESDLVRVFGDVNGDAIQDLSFFVKYGLPLGRLEADHFIL